LGSVKKYVIKHMPAKDPSVPYVRFKSEVRMQRNHNTYLRAISDEQN